MESSPHLDREVLAALGRMTSDRFEALDARQTGEYALLSLRRRRRDDDPVLHWATSRGERLVPSPDARRREPAPFELRIPLPSSRRRKPFLIVEPESAGQWVALFQTRLEEAFAAAWNPNAAPVDLGERRSIRVFPDYGHEWPLWESGTPITHYGIAMEPSDYGLSAELTARLRAWYDFWERHDDWEHGWDTAANHRDWYAEGERVVAALAAELDDIADIVYEEEQPS